MIGKKPSTEGWRRQRLAGAAALLLVGVIGCGALGADSASAAVTSKTVPGATIAPGPRAPPDLANPVRAGDKALAGTVLATAKAAALKAFPGGTVYWVEADADGAAYEAHMIKANGTAVTVKFDKSFTVTAVQNGMGAGGPGGPAGAMGLGGPVGRPTRLARPTMRACWWGSSGCQRS